MVVVLGLAQRCLLYDVVFEPKIGLFGAVFFFGALRFKLDFALRDCEGRFAVVPHSVVCRCLGERAHVEGQLSVALAHRSGRRIEFFFVDRKMAVCDRVRDRSARCCVVECSARKKMVFRALVCFDPLYSASC
jgi:hypothetical protein